MPPPPLLLFASRGVRSMSLLRSCLAPHQHRGYSSTTPRIRSPPLVQICSQRRRAHAVVAASASNRIAAADGGDSSTSTSSSTRSHPPPPRPLPPPPPPTSAYVHLPFCVKKCFYCDFPVRALGEAGAQSLLPNDEGRSRALPEGVASYLETLLSEIEATAPPAVTSHPPPPLQTISFGGGTPSLLPPPEIARIVQALSRKFGGLAENAEVSLEADPGTFDSESVAGYVAAGVTRLSVGVQSFSGDILKGCGRSHGLEDVERALEVVAEARQGGRGGRDSKKTKSLASWSLDLVAGLPGLDLDTWRETLRRTVRAGPDHVSVYDLQLEAGTPFGDAAARLESAARRSEEKSQKGKKEAAEDEENNNSNDRSKLFSLPGPLPPEDDAAQMLREASRVLREAGYLRYEVSNYARAEKRTGNGGEGNGGGKGEGKQEEELEESSHESRHNRVYWRGDEDYYAFGLGASSRLQGIRVTRPRSMRAYSRFVEELARRGDGVPREEDGRFSDPGSKSSKNSSSSSSSSSLTTSVSTSPPRAALSPQPPPTPTPRDVLLEVVMLRLRTREGLDLREVASRWGEGEARAVVEALAPSVAAGLASEETAEKSSVSSSPPSSSSPPPPVWPVVRLTDPEGFLVSNSVISDVFVGLDAVGEEEG